MIIKRFVFNDFAVNTYVVAERKDGECLVIDPGMSTDTEFDKINDFLQSFRLKVKEVVLTHGHFDHWLGVAYFQRQGIRVIMNKLDKFLLEEAEHMSSAFGITVTSVPEINDFLTDGDIVTIDNTKLKVIHTPGHSPGHICLVCEQEGIMFTGDLIFKNSIGRTDLPGGDYDQIARSIKDKILSTKYDYILYPGHGPETELSDELLNNPFIMNIVNS